MLADMVMPLEAGRQLVYVAAAMSNRNDPHITFFGAAAKCHVSDVAMQITADALQLLGGYGYTRDFRPNGWCATPRSPRSTRAPTRSSAW